MKHLIIALSLLTLGFNAQADEDKWKLEVAEYKANLTNRTSVDLTLGLIGNSSKAVVACTSAAIVATTSVLADTLPATGVVSEAIANFADSGYETVDMENFLSWQTFLDTGRGASGGLIVGTVELAEYAALWLFGDEDQSFQGVRKVYESSAATIRELGAEDAACSKSLSKIVLIYGELTKRATESADSGQEFQIQLP